LLEGFFDDYICIYQLVAPRRISGVFLLVKKKSLKDRRTRLKRVFLYLPKRPAKAKSDSTLVKEKLQFSEV
jgi:hypothetical protein